MKNTRHPRARLKQSDWIVLTSKTQNTDIWATLMLKIPALSFPRRFLIFRAITQGSSSFRVFAQEWKRCTNELGPLPAPAWVALWTRNGCEPSCVQSTGQKEREWRRVSFRNFRAVIQYTTGRALNSQHPELNGRIAYNTLLIFQFDTQSSLTHQQASHPTFLRDYSIIQLFQKNGF